MSYESDALLKALSQAVEADPHNAGAKKLFALELYKKNYWAECYPLLKSLFEIDQDLQIEKALHEIERELAKESASESFGFQQNASSSTTVLKELQSKSPDRIDFSDVAGMEEVKESIRMNILYPLQNPEMAKTYGLKAGGGILMYGPPGCGKTYIAKATAGELDATFISVSIHEIASSFAGEGERALHNIFTKARRLAPSVIFFDEIDAVGASRSKLSGSMRTLVNQFLTELDGVTTNNSEVLVVGATNLPWEVDDALRRPGRFDKILFVPPPDGPARERMLELYFKDKPTADINYSILSAATKGFSSADITRIGKETSDAAFRKAVRTNSVGTITTENILHAIGSYQPTVLEWFQTAKSYVTYSNQSGLFDTVAKYISENKL